MGLKDLLFGKKGSGGRELTRVLTGEYLPAVRTPKPGRMPATIRQPVQVNVPAVRREEPARQLTLVAEAKEYAEKTGRCMFCNQPLVDSRSVKAGYGRTCAARMKLPWG